MDLKTTDIVNFVIYYFSGTGNARHVAHWIRDVADNRHVNTELIDISKLEPRKPLIFKNNPVVGFISPTHGFNFSPIMLHFLLKLSRVYGGKAFIVNTRAGLKLGKYFVPGLSGLAQLLSAIILRFKGYKIIGMHPIDLPSNWISVHPGLKKKVVDSIFSKKETGNCALC